MLIQTNYATNELCILFVFLPKCILMAMMGKVGLFVVTWDG